MAKLTGLIKTVIGAAIFRKAIKGAFTIALAKSLNWITRPETLSMLGKHASNLLKSKPAGAGPGILQTMLKGLLAFALLKTMKKSWIAEPALLSTIAALLLAIMKPKDAAQESTAGASGSSGRRDRVIDIDDYTVVEEKL
ncbi:MAG: hypothetical protein EHM14_10450 [Methanothrix sp.]|nr:MAG: hypothetical protein EHM14_10450 [Methanothrix sp.]